MPDWDHLFTEQGKIFVKPHPDMERLAKLFKEQGIQKILDLGCGTGRHLVFFARKGFELYGIDGSPKALEIASKWLKEEGLNAELKNHRMEQRFPFADGFFDAIISIQVIHHNLMRDIIFTIKEIKRILKVKGMIFITVAILKGKAKAKRLDLKEIEKNTYIPQKGIEEGLPHHYFTLEEIYEVFSSFDLQEIYIDDTGHRAILGQKL
ncbi:MAG: class I SAM-dependent methyltransferase [Promethearchaeota archaeon]